MPFQSKEELRIASRKSPLGKWSVHCRWPWKPRGDGVVAQRFFAEAQLGQARIADHQVAGDHRHLDHGLPVLVLLARRALDLGRL